MRQAWMLCVLMAACTSGTPGDDTDSDAVVVALPTVSITAPADGSTVTGPDTSIVIAVQDFELVAKEQSARFVPGPPLGGLWMWMPTADAHEAGEAPAGYLSVRLDDALFAETTSTTVAVTGLAAGEHTVDVELRYPDGDAFYPAIHAFVTFTVAE